MKQIQIHDRQEICLLKIVVNKLHEYGYTWIPICKQDLSTWSSIFNLICYQM